MTNTNYQLRYATQEDADLFYPERLRTFKAWVLEYKCEVVGIAGIVFSHDCHTIFCKTKENFPKKIFWKCTKEVMKEICKMSFPIVAIRDKELESSQRYLTRLGFKFSHIQNNNQEVYLLCKHWQ